MMFRTGGVIRVVLFFLHHGFVPLGFPGKVLMRQHLKRITNSVLLWHPRGNVINHVVDVHNRPNARERERESAAPLRRERDSRLERESPNPSFLLSFNL